jgi:hypothetical protein
VTRAHLVLVFSIVVSILGFAGRARAQSVSTRTQVSSNEIEVGETFTLSFTALVEKGEPAPSNPTIKLPPGFVAHGPSVSSQQQVSLSGGRFFQRQGITATWTLAGARTGRFRIGPPSVGVGGQRVSGEVVEVQIVPQGQGKSQPPDPFGFPNLPGMPKLPPLFGDDEPEPEPDVQNFPEELRITHADDPIAIVRATATPKKVVVGQQVTLRIYAYGRRGPFREANTSEPSREAFVAHTLLENPYAENMYRMSIAGETWYAKKMRELALFPIQSGTLTIGAMKMGFEGRGYPSAGQNVGLVRYSAPLGIEVVEPPRQGRPAGYKLGDVGRYTLSANVDPREITAGEAVSVVAKLEGTGNVPFTLRTPQQKGVTFLEPTTVEEVEPRGSTIAGWRKFTYVVRIDEAGSIDLGELALPYWDPERDSYQTTSVPLGKIEVRPGKTDPKAADSENTDALQDVVTTRKTLDAPASARSRWTDRNLFWFLLLAGPSLVVITAGVRSAGARMKEHISRRSEDQLTAAQRALALARKTGSSDPGKTASEIERAIFSAIFARTGRKMRAVLKSDLARELTESGVSNDTASRIVELLQRCDDLRFTGESESESGVDLVESASGIVSELSRGKRRKENGS